MEVLYVEIVDRVWEWLFNSVCTRRNNFAATTFN